MAHPTAPHPAQRIAVLGTVFALHLVLLLLVLAASATRAPPMARPGILSVVSLTADRAAQTPPPPPTVPAKIAETSRPVTELVVADEYDPAATAAPVGGCATLEAVSAALLADPLAVAAILRAPPEARSIADAIVMWNAGWSAAAASVDAPLAAVRARADQTLRALDDACLDEPLAGPRLIPVPVGARTTFIVFGSGNWHWRELVADGDGAPAIPFATPDSGVMVAPLPRF